MALKLGFQWFYTFNISYLHTHIYIYPPYSPLYHHCWWLDHPYLHLKVMFGHCRTWNHARPPYSRKWPRQMLIKGSVRKGFGIRHCRDGRKGKDDAVNLRKWWYICKLVKNGKFMEFYYGILTYTNGFGESDTAIPGIEKYYDIGPC
jgi:hypothetical protein